ncbi:MAG TPA: ClbS/DfsB family four-helix bundle protein [Blastocatellia bacterium]|nr:ClbS/DfsB family four-helix bundle protein [Blastocatellia bacterium]
MRYKSKQSLMDDIRTEHDSLCALLRKIPTARWHEHGVWGDGWTLSDLVAHLAEWQQMFLGWYEVGLGGTAPEMPAPGYKWSQTPKLNRAIWEKHRSRSQAATKAAFDSGYCRILHIVEALSPEQLLTPGTFPWTGKHPLTTYLGPNTASHYRFAIKAINRWLKGVPEAGSPARRPKRLQPTKARAEMAKMKATRPRPSRRKRSR